MKQLTIKTFPKERPNITLEQIQAYIEKDSHVGEYGLFGNKDIRLVLELVTQNRKTNPTLMEIDFYDQVRLVLDEDVSTERINVVKPFGEICFKEVIVFKNGKARIKKIIRWRNPENLKKLRQRNV